MWNTTKRFFKENDGFGSPILQNMNGATTIGTALGGILTLISSGFFFVFITAQLYFWVVEPTYSQSSELSFLTGDISDEDKYTIPLQKLMPAFSIIDFSK